MRPGFALLWGVALLAGALGGCGSKASGLAEGYLESQAAAAPAGQLAQAPGVEAGPGPTAAAPAFVRLDYAAPPLPLAGATLPDLDKPVGTDVQLAQAARPGGAGSPSSQPSEQAGYVRWRQRRGPAYPGDFWTSFGRDAKEMPATLWDDTKATFTNPWTLVGLGIAGAAGISLASTNADDRVADHFTKHGSQLNTFWDSVGDAGGNPGTHFAFAGAMYFTTLATGRTQDYEVSKALLNALVINGLLTEGLKAACRTDSPNGDPLGWPSGHASSSFALATVLGEAYGPWVGIPLFLGASFVGYERIDARNHDFSDVISGAFIGVAIGHAVMQNHKPKVFGFEVMPYADPDRGSVGVAMVKRF